MMADIAPDQIEKSLENLRHVIGEKVNVEEHNKFTGLDAVDKVMASDVDVVLLTTPPGFRAEHFEKSVKAGKHAFVEKPVGVDGPTVRRFIAAAEESKKKGLGCQSGLLLALQVLRARDAEAHPRRNDRRSARYLRRLPGQYSLGKAAPALMDGSRVPAPQLDVFHLALRRSHR